MATKPVLLTFCGTLDGSFRWTTIGDVMALYNVALELHRRGQSVRIAYHGWLFELNHLRVAWKSCREDDFSALVYVCGPLQRLARTIAERFPRLPAIAVGVSVIENNDATALYPHILARDGPLEASFDLALADIGYPHLRLEPHHRMPGLGLCLVGPQSEYGHRDHETQFTNRMGEILSILPYRRRHLLSTLVRRGPLPYISELELQSATTVITNRLHGALVSIYHRRPVVAIDKISSGAKVSRVLRRIDWPVFSLADDETNSVLRWEGNCRTGWNEKMESSRSKMIKEAREVLERAINLIINHASA